MNFFKFAAAAAVAATLATAAHATPSGSLGGSFNRIMVVPTGTAVSAASLTSFSYLNTAITDAEGSFAAEAETGGPSGSITIASLSGMTLNTGAGTFDATSVANVIRNTSTNTLELELYGDFTGAGDLSAYNDLPASMDIQLNQVGGAGTAISGAYTLSVPPKDFVVPSVPEPVSMTVLATGLAGLGLIRRKRA